MEPTLLPYTITAISPRQLQIRPNCYKWSLGLPDAQSVINNPITTSGEGVTFTALAVLTRTDPGFEGHTYYLEEEQTPHGWDSTDCEAIVPVSMPEPHILPTGALPVPNDTTPFEIIVDTPAYSTANDAANHLNQKSIITPGQYQKYTEKYGMINVTEVQGVAGSWINPADNMEPLPPEPEPKVPSSYIGPRENLVSPPPPEPVVVIPEVFLPSEVPIGNAGDTKWKSTYKSFHPEQPTVSDTYELLTEYNMKEYSGMRKAVQLTAHRHINVAGTFTKNGVKFYRARDYTHDVTFAWYYGIPLLNDDNLPILKKVVEEPSPQRLLDLFRWWKDDLRNYLGHKEVWDIVFKNKKGTK